MRYFACLILACFLGGCLTYGNEAIRTETDQSLGQKITRGKTTKAEVKAALGDPMSTGLTDSGNEQWMYMLGSSTPGAVNFIPYVNLVASQSTAQSKTISILFDKRGVVINYTMNDSQTDVRSGLLGTSTTSAPKQ